jgi:hypothetical protein
MKLPALIVAVLLTLVASNLFPVAAEPPDAEKLRTSLRTVEGEVVGVSSLPAEGDLPVVAVTLDVLKPTPERLQILLAPENVLRDIDFKVEQGDALRARIFVADGQPSKVHKAMNLTRGTMVRFRTLRKIPLWNAAGEWDGGPCLRNGESGGGGYRHRRGTGR